MKPALAAVATFSGLSMRRKLVLGAVGGVPIGERTVISSSATEMLEAAMMHDYPGTGVEFSLVDPRPCWDCALTTPKR